MSLARTLHALAAERVAARDIDVTELIAKRREKRETDLAWEAIHERRHERSHEHLGHS